MVTDEHFTEYTQQLLPLQLGLTVEQMLRSPSALWPAFLTIYFLPRGCLV